ncbi:hypothetical protein [Saccharothrix variisporea]|uniref:hypothetical protein n=1 Tax=Saccharothrix variisporea TaxID=543527 RepID=UPI001B869DC3|nr:hypothetical protein [Saccharothrix variisporea]
MPSPTTKAFHPRYGFFNAANSRDVSSRRSQGTDRDWPTSKASSVMTPPNGSTNFRVFPNCQPRDVSGSWLSSVEHRP